MPTDPTEITLHISLPDTFTISHWEIFADSRQTYIARCEDSGRTASALLADYHGALARIRAGYVHISGLPELSQTLSSPDQTNTPLEIVGLIVREVSRKMEAALTTPPNFSNGSSATSTTQPVTPAQPN